MLNVRDVYNCWVGSRKGFFLTHQKFQQRGKIVWAISLKIRSTYLTLLLSSWDAISKKEKCGLQPAQPLSLLLYTAKKRPHNIGMSPVQFSHLGQSRPTLSERDAVFWLGDHVFFPQHDQKAKNVMVFFGGVQRSQYGYLDVLLEVRIKG